ncbi:MAG TPA: hypothetical protein VGP72_11945 [Planctomycetota bacterium]|jgi:hypothetical protein
MTPRVQQTLLERVVEDDYRGTARSLEITGQSIAPGTAGALLREIGAEIHAERFGPEATIRAPQVAPPNPPELLLLLGDGARYRTNEADVRKTDDPQKRKARGQVLTDEDRGWREDKVGVVVRARKGFVRPDGDYQPPEEVVKTYVATTGDIQQFGRDMRTEAERRGYLQAPVVVWCSDHGHGLPEMRAREFPRAHVVTDFFHTAERLAECARGVCGEGDVAKRPRQKFFHRLRALLYDGKLDKVLQTLSEEATRRSPRPKQPAALTENPLAQVLWTHVFYIEKHRDTMNYPLYRAQGWPIGSGAAESACGQFGNRFKHARMRWTKVGAEAGHQVKAAILSQDGQWEQRWPPPIPLLDFEKTANWN